MFALAGVAVVGGGGAVGVAGRTKGVVAHFAVEFPAGIRHDTRTTQVVAQGEEQCAVFTHRHPGVGFALGVKANPKARADGLEFIDSANVDRGHGGGGVVLVMGGDHRFDHAAIAIIDVTGLEADYLCLGVWRGGQGHGRIGRGRRGGVRRGGGHRRGEGGSER